MSYREKSPKLTWDERKKYILSSSAMTIGLLILTLILAPNFGTAGTLMSIVTGLATTAALVFVFIHIYVVFFNDLDNF